MLVLLETACIDGVDRCNGGHDAGERGDSLEDARIARVAMENHDASSHTRASDAFTSATEWNWADIPKHRREKLEKLDSNAP